MMNRVVYHACLFFVAASVTLPDGSAAQYTATTPTPLTLAEVIRIAGQQRQDIRAARARIRGEKARSGIVSALDDPMISAAINHKPFMMSGADVSLAIEQQIPLSGVRGHRRASALADLTRVRADAARATLDVGVHAANAFLMLQERRRTATTVLGLLPLLWEFGVGADVSARTAAPVVGGLWACLILTLFVLPAAYTIWRRRQVSAAAAAPQQATA